MSDEELEWAASNGLPRNAKSYDLNFAELGQGVQHLTPQQFRDMKANMEVTFWGWKIPESVAPSLLSDIVRGGSAWRAAQGNPQAETQYIADQRRILAAAVGADKVDWAIRDAEHWRAELKTKNPAFERVLNDFGAFTSARVVAQLYQHTGRLAEFSNLTEKRKGAKR